MVVWLILAIVVLLGILAWVLLVVGVVFFRPRQLAPPVRDALILAPHSDDCVIGAGEYGIAAGKAGRQVRVVYLTREASPEKAAQRQQEAIAAWKLTGVGADSLEFLDFLPTDERQRSSALHSEELDRAQARIVDLLGEQPKGTAVFFPAAGESHLDHRTLRRIAQQALIESERDDLMMLQYAEYNYYLSLFYCPWKTIISLGLLIPVLRRWLQAGRMSWSKGDFRAPQVGFVGGPPPVALAPDQERLALKLEMLNCFESQDLRLVRGFFSHPDRYQHVAQARVDCSEQPRGFLRTGSMYWGPTAILMWLWLCGTVGLLAYWLARLVNSLAEAMSVPSWIDLSILLLLAGVILLFGFARYKGQDSWSVQFFAALGLVAGVF